MGEMGKTPAPDDFGSGDDIVTVFQLEGRPVRGRVVRLGATANAILSAHAYPVSVAHLVGEAAMIACNSGTSP